MLSSILETPSKEDISSSHELIRSFIHRTPILTSHTLNRIAGCDLYFKCENFQKIGAFKMRGATNAVARLSQEELKNGVATHSSGNHAAALALAAKEFGTKAYIVMPRNAPQVKKNAVAGYGAEIIECDPNLAARESNLETVVKQTGAKFIHPFDNYSVIAGQATAAKELIEDGPFFDFIIAPVGGGGLLSGTALACSFYSNHTKVIGSEPEGANDAFQSFNANKLIPVTNPKTIADGLLTSLSEKTFDIIQKHVYAIYTVNDDEIRTAMRLIWERMKIIIEPSCAVPFAAVLKNKEWFEGKKVGIILSGGNVDLDQFRFT